MSDTVPHITLDMTEERKARWMKAVSEILPILERDLKPVEALAVLDQIRKQINDRYFLGSYKGTHLIPRKPVPESVCPGCGTKLDAVSDPTGGQPEAGDVSVCAACGEILEFAEDRTLHRPNPTRRALIESDGKVMAMVAAIKEAARERALLAILAANRREKKQ